MKGKSSEETVKKIRTYLGLRLHSFVSSIFLLAGERDHGTIYKIMHVALDDVIPFSEYFIVPYMIWFFYVSGAVLYFFFTDKQDYFRLCTFLFIGMTISMMICTFYPNGTDLRVEVDPNKNVFCYLVQMIHNSDTPANVFPSIHVYNSLGVHISVMNSERLRNHKWVRRSSFIIMVAICMSTVFLKQHSVVDVTGAMVLAYVMYQFVYGNAYVLSHRAERQKVTG